MMSGLRQACRGRPVSDDQLALLAQQVEEQLRSSGVSNVSSEEVGKAILPFLRNLDEVAYLRFASVYRAFDSAEDFLDAIHALRGQAPEKEMAPAAPKATTESPAPKKRRARRKADPYPSLLDD